MTTPRRGFVDFRVPTKYWKANRDLTYLEASIMYLHDELKMKPHQIAKKLDRKLSSITTQLYRIRLRRESSK